MDNFGLREVDEYRRPMKMFQRPSILEQKLVVVGIFQNLFLSAAKLTLHLVLSVNAI
jgi:hypothetical protein